MTQRHPARECLQDLAIILAEVLALELARHHCGVSVQHKRSALRIALERVLGHAQQNALEDRYPAGLPTRSALDLAVHDVAQDRRLVFGPLRPSVGIAALAGLELMRPGWPAVADITA